MGNTKAKRHTHKYHKITLNGDKVWACASPDCNHYMPAHQTVLVQGKRSVCWGNSEDCEDTLILDPSNMIMDRPLCDECTAVDLRKTLRKSETQESEPETDDFYQKLISKDKVQ